MTRTASRLADEGAAKRRCEARAAGAYSTMSEAALRKISAEKDRLESELTQYKKAKNKSEVCVT